ncbi:non-ribosomal peptide synthase domain TIGR01720/amino acid adenylation domain-containing protein [Chitinophaga eiseniae]|uniref:Non-ribosomal peptide synthase domain TIGR01720/amino acid adenylation domain-containing protein n=1 Tax=Chitinophaga eiseniae TaxID=634771 RepID=A0A1T4U225_9BACT|nr:non-ribosomal peptide synthetase [Chitinophaga eiseniae]SKA46690.1 non-ribosomal peptide synthase domain TIGR01720/amino acid adenylation domain-containing protein [Chitinophaga eiseniae]
MNLHDKGFIQSEQATLVAALEPVESKERHASPEDYWISQLTGELPVLNLPGYRNRQLCTTYSSASVNYSFPQETLEILRSFTEKQHITLFTLLSAGVQVLLHKYARQCDIITGAYVNCMSMPFEKNESENLLPIRTRIDKDISIQQLLKLQQHILQEAYTHRHYSPDELRAKLNTGITFMPEVYVALNGNTPVGAPPPGICFSFTTDDGLQLSIIYNADAYDNNAISRMAGHYQQVLSGMTENEVKRIRDISYITPAETTELLMLNRVQAVSQEDETIIDLIEDQACRHPGKTAIVFNEQQFSYQELDNRSDRLANYLSDMGVQPGTCVLLCFNNHMDHALTGILGIMKTGAAYVPLDADLPKERIAYLIKDTNASIVITNTLDAASFDHESLQVIPLDDEQGQWQKASPDKKHRKVQKEDLAYVIYTSGTTGDPKGVMITQGNLSDYFKGLDQQTGISANKASALMSTPATDLGNTVLFGSLIYGNTLHLFSKDTLRDVGYIHQYFTRHEIDCIKIVPTYWKALEYSGQYLLPRKMIIFGGEQLQKNTADRIREALPGLRIINHYGPTETTIGKLLYEITDTADEAAIPIGKPFSNTCVYVVDEELSPCAKGIWGELLIGGDGLFRGYLNQPDLTEEKCVRFNNERLYRTGDMVRINEKGEIEFGYRIDNQVKIQGYRIEPGGIETVVLQYPFIKQCFVATVENEHSDKLLVAYLQVKEGYSDEALKEHLREHLPTYMIPSFLATLPAIPMTSNGKVDRKKLPGADLLKASGDYEPPHTEIQQIVVGILEEMFNRERISLTDNFFEMGGDSIKSIQVASRLRQRGYKLQLKDIIRHPVVKDFTAQVKVNTTTGVKEDMFTGAITLSPIQQYFFESKRGNYHHYNQSVALQATAIDEISIGKAFDKLVQFHDTLRIKYRQENDQSWHQYYDSPDNVYSFETIPYTDESTIPEKTAAAGKSLNIKQGPLMRVCLFKGGATDVLYIVIHHLLTDGVSFRILIEDLTNLYNKYRHGSGFDLQNKSASFKEWMVKLQEYTKKDTVRAELPYWLHVADSRADRISTMTAVSNTIADRDIVSFSIGKTATADLLTRCYRKHNTEINEILITALCLALQEVFHTRKVLLNLEGHGREDIGLDADISRTMGWFTSIFPVYFDLHTTVGYIDTLLAIKRTLNTVPAKGIGYGLLKYLSGADGLDVQPEITFNYLGDFSSGLSSNNSNVFHNVKFNYQDADTQTTCGDKLNFTGVITDQQLCMYINFNRLLFNKMQVKMLGEAFNNHLLKIIDQIVLH